MTFHFVFIYSNNIFSLPLLQELELIEEASSCYTIHAKNVSHSHLRRRVHEVKLQQVLYSQRFQQKHNVRQVGSLDFWHCRDQEFILVRVLRVQSETLSKKLFTY